MYTPLHHIHPSVVLYVITPPVYFWYLSHHLFTSGTILIHTPLVCLCYLLSHTVAVCFRFPPFVFTTTYQHQQMARDGVLFVRSALRPDTGNPSVPIVSSVKSLLFTDRRVSHLNCVLLFVFSLSYFLLPPIIGLWGTVG